MRRDVRTKVAGASLALSLFATMVLAEGPPPAPEHPPCQGDYALPVAPWARPSNTPLYDGGYVGGGCLFRGEPREPAEGVWGWDYQGWCFSRRVWLGWSHGRRYQGGTGAYKTDGPPLPSVFPHNKKSED